MDDKSFELLSKIYSEFTEQFKVVREDIKDIRKDIEDIKVDVKDLKKDVVRIENNHGAKLDALFDGYKQHNDILERIESEVTKQEEIIMRRVK